MERGKDFRDLDAVMEQAEIVYRNYTESVETLIRKYSSSCTIFHNAGHITRGRRDLAAVNSHLELESLPTGGWGYDHFPMSAAYVSCLGMEYLGMTGKFHNTWGEFGGFKHPNALRYEAALSLAFGAKCSIGDQMHPNGMMDEGTYQLIGEAYQEVESKEQWCVDAHNCYDIAILSDEAVNSRIATRDDQFDSDTGANRMMLEGNYLYCLIDLESDFTKFKLIILPDHIRLTRQLAHRLTEYIRQGGKILATGESGLDTQKQEFLIDLHAKYLGANAFCPDYLIPCFDLKTGNSAHVMYGRGHNIKNESAVVFAKRENPYFNRDLLNFSSHQHTPNDPSFMFDAAVMSSQTAYIGWNLFEDYARTGSLHLKELVTYTIDQLLKKEKTIEVQIPDRAISTLCKQDGGKDGLPDRYIHHILFAHTTIRGNFVWDNISHVVEVIEDLVPLTQVNVKIKLKDAVQRVYLAPQMEELPFEMIEDSIQYTVPKVDCHQMIVLDMQKS